MNNPQNDSLAKRVLDRIEGEHLAPRPRWEFLARDWFFWSLGGLSVAFGSVAIAAGLFEVANAGWRFYAATHHDFLTFFVAVAPFLWLLALALFILLGYENIRRTRRGYRYPFWLIALGAVLTSALIGAALFAAGAGEFLDDFVGDHPPFYRPVEVEEHALWLSPARGLLGGTIVSVSSTSDSFTLKDFDGNLWQIGASGLSTTSAAVVERGGEVRVIGVPSGSATSTLDGCYVFSWQTYGAEHAQPAPAPFAPPPETSQTDVRNQVCKGIRSYRE